MESFSLEGVNQIVGGQRFENHSSEMINVKMKQHLHQKGYSITREGRK